MRGSEGRLSRSTITLAAFSAWLLIVATCASLASYTLHKLKYDASKHGERPFPADALSWPWENFPSITPVELKAAHEILGQQGPLLRADLRPWSDIPSDGPFGFPRDGRRALLESSSVRMKRIAQRRTTQIAISSQWNPDAEEYRATMMELSRANAGPSRFVALYNRGILQLWKGQVVAAAQDLQVAVNELDSYLRNPLKLASLSVPQQGWLYEASIHAHYALGHALLQSERPSRSILEFKMATQHLRNLLDLRWRRYTREGSDLHNFSIRPTGLSTWALWNDLVAAYLSNPDYHACPLPSQNPSLPDCSQMAANSSSPPSCKPLAKIYCRGEEIATKPYSNAWSVLSKEIYLKGNWNQEHRLWALAHLMGLASVDGSLSEDPYTLYNSASLLLSLGEIVAATDQAERATKSREFPARDLRTDRLSVILQIMTDQPVALDGMHEVEESGSQFREAFFDLYDQEARASAFGRQDHLFADPSKENLIDRWLFIRLWRQRLRQGDLTGFLKEYDKFTAYGDFYLSFFEEWRRSVFEELGKRAIEEARETQEQDRAEAILSFLSESDLFPKKISRDAQDMMASGTSHLRWWLVVGSSALVSILAGLLLIGLTRLYWRTFTSSYRASQMRSKSTTAAHPEGT